MRATHTESWQPIASTLGFRTEEEMLKHLYIQQAFSLSEMSKILGFSTWSVRRRLQLLGVPMKQRGGAANRLGRRRLAHLTDAELEEGPIAVLAAKEDVHMSTIFAEKRLRRQTHGVLPDHTNKVPQQTRDKDTQPYGAGPVAVEE